MMWWIFVIILIVLIGINFIDFSGCKHEKVITGCGYTVCKKCGMMF